MKKIFGFITISALVIGLVGFLFNLGDYDFFVQFSKIESLGFTNPIDELRILINNANQLFDFNGQSVAWYEYIPLFFKWLGLILQFPILLVKDIALNVYFGLQAILFILGF